MVFGKVQKLVNGNDIEDNYKNKYKPLCKKAGGVLRTVGLIQFLTFLKAKSMKPSEVHHWHLLMHIQEELNELNILTSADIDSMLACIRRQSLPEYMVSTTEVLHLLQWHKRFSDVLIEGTVNGNGGE